jgi:hypothetical protein
MFLKSRSAMLPSPEATRSGPRLLRAVRSARAISAALSMAPYAKPGHFYSPSTTPEDAARAMTWALDAGPEVPGIDLAVGRQLALFAELAPVIAETPPGPRYDPRNSQYGAGDGAVYRAMLNRFRPSRVIEVGSGFSTAVVLDETDRGLNASVTCIEPYPDRLLGQPGGAKRVLLHRKPVQDVPPALFATLGAEDVLFIDSTHVVKAGSDVVWLFLHVLPTLKPGVIVHVHDVFWPFEYPAKWLGERRDWTEDYLLRAFLIGNADWEVLLFSNWLWRCHPELVPAHLAAPEPSSIWLRRRGAPLA